MKVQLFPETCYRLSLFPVIGEEARQLIDENGFDMGTFYELDRINTEENDGEYDMFFDFYSSDDSMEYSAGEEDAEELEDNALYVDRSKFDLEECEEEPDDDFILIGNMTEPEGLDNESREIFKDIKDRHNDSSDDEHVNIVFDAICRRMRQVAERLVEEGMADDAESVKFVLQFGQASGVQYVYDIDTDDYDPDLLRTLGCADWNDCGDCETIQEYWPDRLLGNVVYDGKFYAGSCEQTDDYDFSIDLVNCHMESLT